MTTTNANGEDTIHPYPNLLVPELTSHLLTPSLANIHAPSYAKLIDLIKKDHMTPFYRSLFSSSPASTFSLSSLTLSPLSPSSPKLGRKELEGGPLGRMDESLVQELEAENAKVLSEFEKKIEEAEKVEGESEIAEAWREKAMYLTRIGEKVWPSASSSSSLATKLVLNVQEQAIAAQRTALEKTAGVGSKIDISLTLVRIGIFFEIIELQKEFLTKAEE
jgi:26S proteasome regulatory subunit N7